MFLLYSNCKGIGKRWLFKSTMQKTQARFVKMRAKTSAFVTFRGPSLYRGKNILNARAKWRVYATIWRTYAPNVKSNESQNSFYPKYRLKGFNLTFGPYFDINLERFPVQPCKFIMHATISCHLAQIVMNVYIYIYIIYLQNPVRTEWSWNMNAY